jgi:hypothetical protein
MKISQKKKLNKRKPSAAEVKLKRRNLIFFTIARVVYVHCD